MELRVGALKICGGDVEILLCRNERGVPEEFLDKPGIHSAIEQMRGKRVPTILFSR